jgi:hypothetical protein
MRREMIAVDKYEQFAFNHYRDALALIRDDSLDIPYINQLIAIGDRHVRSAIDARLEDAGE